MARYQFDASFEVYFANVCNRAESMAQAAVVLGMNYKTLCFHAKRLNCFKPNQAGKGFTKKPSKQPVPLEDIFNGRHYTYQTHKLKKRLIKEGYKKHQCESCGLSKWFNDLIPLELHHKDGDRKNNSFSNLNLLCPNCHAFTENYRAKNIKNLSARIEMFGVEPLNVGEAFQSAMVDGNPEPSSNKRVLEKV